MFVVWDTAIVLGDGIHETFLPLRWYARAEDVDLRGTECVVWTPFEEASLILDMDNGDWIDL